MAADQPSQVDQQLVGSIARQLGEEYPYPIRCIERTIAYCGEDFALQVLDETLKIEAQGGMSLEHLKRKRTPGGVFFLLVRENVDDETREKIFNTEDHPHWIPPRTRPIPDGEIRQVEITLKGRPGKLEKRDDLVILTLHHPLKKIPSLPQGVPQPRKETVKYRVYVSMKQWRLVEEYLHIPEDEIVVQGFYAPDPETDGMAVFAIMTTTRQRDWLVRRRQVEAGEREKASPTPPKKKGKQKKEQATKRPQPNPNMPDKIARKLEELHAAAEVLRQKVARLEKKPKNQQAGLPMTLRLLQNTEAQIRAIEKDYPPEG